MGRQLDTYIIYKITSPDGTSYIGATKSTVDSRWRQHKRRAEKEQHRPFYKAILEYSGNGFSLEVIASCGTKEEADRLEIEHIARVGLENLYNVSPGGENDIKIASKVFWERMDKDPDGRASYIEKLCLAQQGRPEGTFDNFARAGTKWRKDNIREAWRIRHRATRVAAKVNTTTGVKKALREDLQNRPLKERLLAKHKGIYVRLSESTKKMWANRTDAEIAEVGRRISKGLSDKRLTDPEYCTRIKESAENARKGIDRVKQGKAASIGVKKYWADLKADPERYAAHMKAKTDKMLATVKLKLESEGGR